MNVEGFIAGRLHFKGRVAAIATAVSFFVIIVAVAISSGFRREIRSGVSAVTGDVLLTNAYFNYYSDSNPIETDMSYMPTLEAVDGVEKIAPAIYRAGIVRQGDEIQGLLFKGTEADTSSLCARIPSGLAEKFGLAPGDDMVSYFVSDRVKIRKFKVGSIYDSPVDTGDNMIVYLPISDLRRLNGWEENEASILEVTLDERFHNRGAMKRKSDEIGTIASLCASEDEDTLVATSASEKYYQLFDWLDLIDFNVVTILILMTIVAGFNMISGLLILLFRNVSTIGMLKAMGMTDKGIAKVFLRVAARLVAIGMAVGNAVALLFCLIQGTTHLIKLNPENYFVSFVPVSVNVPFIIAADMAAFAVIMLLLLIPSLFISKIDPSSTVKTE